MSGDGDAWMESAFTSAARQIPVPPEAQWMPDAARVRSGSSWPATALTIGVLIAAVALSVNAIRMSSASRVGAAPSEVAASPQEVAVWQGLRADLPPWVPLLRPTWLPARLTALDAGCGIPIRGGESMNWSTTGIGDWSVEYRPDAAGADCPRLSVNMHVLLDRGVAVVGSLDAPAANETLVQTVSVRGASGVILKPDLDETELRLVFSEGPFVYRVVASGLSLEELVRVAQSLKEVEGR